MTWVKVRKKLIRLSIQASITIALLEFFLFILVKMGLINIMTPTYHLPKYGYFLPVRSHIFGYQHEPNSAYYINKTCLSTSFRFNSLGFRGLEHQKKSNKTRAIVIGDSYMEGLGVNEEDRLSSILEKKLNIPHLNFGMAGKSPSEEYVIYDSVASKYEHDIVLWSLFPSNDLTDDNPANRVPNNIGPCWDGEYPNYQLKYFPDSAPDILQRPLWKRIMMNFTYSYNALHKVKNAFAKNTDYKYSGYFIYTDDQLDRLTFSIIKLSEKAKNKKIIIFCIPSQLDYDTTIVHTRPSIDIPLQKLCDSLNIEYIGLYDEFKHTDTGEPGYFLSCDGHWSEIGHIKAMEAILEKSATYRALSKSSE